MAPSIPLGLIYLPSSLFLLLLGAAVYLTAPKKSNHRWFLVLMSALAGWMFFYYLASLDESMETIWLDRLTIALALVLPVCFLYFSEAHIKYVPIDNMIKRITGILGSILAIFTLFTPYTYASIADMRPSGGIVMSVGPVYIMVLTYIAFVFSGLFFYLRNKCPADIKLKKQVDLLLLGAGLVVVVNIFEELYYSYVENQYADFFHPFITPASLMVFSLMIAYGMVFRKLFDIRSSVVRALVYGFSVVVLAMIYALVVVVIAKRLLGINLDNWHMIVLSLIFAVVAVSFNAIRLFFDKVSSSIFYKDQYDSDLVVSGLNDFYLQTNDLQLLISHTTEVLKTTIRSTSLEVVVKANDFYVSSKGAGSQLEIMGRFNILNASHDVLYGNSEPCSDSVFAAEFVTDFSAGSVIFKFEDPDNSTLLAKIGLSKTGMSYSHKDYRLIKTVFKNLSLAVRSASQYSQIVSFNVILQKEISAAVEELKRTNHQLVITANAKDEMIATLSHQLIPQLTAARGFFELIIKDRSASNELMRLGEYSMTRMIRMSQDMLTGIVFHHRKPELKLSSIDIVELTVEVVESLQVAFERNGITHQFKGLKSLRVDVDRIKMSEILYNLIDNAIQYSYKSSAVQIVFTQSSVSIVDTGIGISAKEERNLFSKYYRTKAAKAQRPSGTGVGLFVAKVLTKAHGMKLSYRPNQPSGSIFTIEFSKNPNSGHEIS